MTNRSRAFLLRTSAAFRNPEDPVLTAVPKALCNLGLLSTLTSQPRASLPVHTELVLTSGPLHLPLALHRCLL